MFPFEIKDKWGVILRPNWNGLRIEYKKRPEWEWELAGLLNNGTVNPTYKYVDTTYYTDPEKAKKVVDREIILPYEKGTYTEQFQAILDTGEKKVLNGPITRTEELDNNVFIVTHSK